MAKPNFQFEKRQREMEKRKKKEEKLQRKLEKRKSSDEGDEQTPSDGTDEQPGD